MRISLTALVASCALLAPLSAAHADTYDFTLSTTASGTLNGISFSNEALTISGSYLSSSISSGYPGSYTAATGPLTFTLAGTGTFSSSSATNTIFDNQGASVAGITGNEADLLDTGNSAYASYNLYTSIGPITGTDAFQGSDTTTDGELRLSSASSVTFTNTDITPGGGNLSPTPEPSSLALMSTGLLSLAGFARRRFRRA